MRIKSEAERKFLEAVFNKLGFSTTDSARIADQLVDADLRGISSHGIHRLSWYRGMVKNHILTPKAKVEVVKESPGLVLIDGHQNAGQVAATFGMNKAIEKAQKTGIGASVVKHSGHFGAAGYYSRLALKAGLVGIAMTNTRALTVPTNALEAFLGSNAFSFGFPASPHPFIFDAATSVISAGKIQIHQKRGERLPGEWVVDDNRYVVKDPDQARDVIENACKPGHGGGILTLGGTQEENSNYKGMGFSLIIELLTGILAQDQISADQDGGSHDHFFLALDPAFFGDPDQLQKAATAMFDRLRHLKHLPGKKIWVPGDREYRLLDENKVKGVEVDDQTYAEIKKIGDELSVEVPESLSWRSFS